MDDLWAVTEELDNTCDAIRPYLRLDKNGTPYVAEDAPEGTEDLYAKAKELGKKQVELQIKYGVQF